MHAPLVLVALLIVMSPPLNGYSRNKRDDVGNANSYIDEVLNNFRNNAFLVSKIDPLNIPDVKEKKLELWNGIVHGLSSLYRHGDCFLEYDGENVKVTAELGVRNVDVYTKYRAKALTWIKGIVKLHLEAIAVKLVVSIKGKSINLETFKVVHLGKYKVKKITGLSFLLNWLLKLIVNGIAKKSRGKIIAAIEGKVADALREKMRKIKFPGIS